MLFIDEVHRFTKGQQDALLPAVENRWVTLVAATTENPFFSVVSPLLSRSLLLTLEPLTDDDIRDLIARALADERGLGGAVEISAEAPEPPRPDRRWRRAAGADRARGRRGVRGRRWACRRSTSPPSRRRSTGPRCATTATATSTTTSSARSSSRSAAATPTPALHYLARMLEAGEDPRFIARRLVILASARTSAWPSRPRCSPRSPRPRRWT